LAVKEAQLRLALDNMPGGMLLLDRDLNYVLFNSQYSELYEYPDGLVRVGGSIRGAWRYRADRGVKLERLRVRYWLQADLQPPEIDFRSTPESRHSRGRH
jgi:PAS domain-containing protein